MEKMGQRLGSNKNISYIIFFLNGELLTYFKAELIWEHKSK